jgi:hypothetical protein
MNRGNGLFGLLVIIALIWGVFAIFSEDEPEYSSQLYADSANCIEPENPYSEAEEGHYAGFEWALNKGVSSCGGNSKSFIEGCEEYLSQEADFEACENY